MSAMATGERTSPPKKAVVRSRPADGEATDPDAGVVDHGDRSRVEILFDGGQVGEEAHRLLVGSASGAATEEDDRGHGDVSGGKQPAEVGVGRDEHPPFGCRPGEYLLVVSPREP